MTRPMLISLLAAIALTAACDATYTNPAGGRAPSNVVADGVAITPSAPLTWADGSSARPSPVDCHDQYWCDDPATLGYCFDDRTYQADCAAVCEDAGYDVSYGCGDEPDSGQGTCWCDYTCDDDDEPALCLDGGTIETCEWGTWVVTDCEVECLQRGYDGALGCEYDPNVGGEACVCFRDAPSAPTPQPPTTPACTEGAAWCIASDLLQTCDLGEVRTLDCDNVCRDAGYDFAESCAFDPTTGVDGCFCGNYVCASDELTCADGSCVPDAWVCDGIVDCANADDEYQCAACNDSDPALCVGSQTIEFCQDGELVSYDCDALCRESGYDFADTCSGGASAGGDGCVCGVYECALDEFQCGDGSCIDVDWRCDGIQDCGGAQDELGCVAQCDPRGPAVCLDDYTLEYCSATSRVEAIDCDTVCMDAGYDYAQGCAADPEYPGDTCFCAYDGCAPDEFTCDDGACIPGDYVCDGYLDCAMDEDERYCGSP